MSGLAALSECDRVILRAFYGKSAMTSLFYCYFTKRKDEKMKYRKITALIFAVTLGLTTLTACTKQSDEKATESTVAQSSAVSSEEEKDCCKEKESCCEDEEESDCCKDKEKSDNSTEEKSCCHKESDESSTPDCCKNEESSEIPDCCEG